jgi:hypothetical protein
VTFRLPVAVVTVRVPTATPVINAALPPSQVLTVAWPRCRVTQSRMPGRPAVIALPARTQLSARMPLPMPAFRAAELMRQQPRRRLGPSRAVRWRARAECCASSLATPETNAHRRAQLAAAERGRALALSSESSFVRLL